MDFYSQGVVTILYHGKWENCKVGVSQGKKLLISNGEPTRRSFHLLVGAMLTFGTSVVGNVLTSSLTGQQSWGIRLLWIAAGLLVTFLYLRWQLRSLAESPDVIDKQVEKLASGLRSLVRSRSYGARRNLIAAPLRQLDLQMTPRVGWVRDPSLAEPEPISKKTTDIVAAFKSSKRRLLIVGEPGSGKTMAAYSLIEHLDKTEGEERTPLLINLSAWGGEDDFEEFLVGYLCSPVGYVVPQPAVAKAFISSRRYSLILDGLDEIPAGLRQHFFECFDEFVGGLPSEVAVVVTCRTQEYEELLATHPTGLGLVQAVEILPLTSQQLDSAIVELAKFDKDWQKFLSQRHHTAYQPVRDLLSNPLFLNLAVVGRLRPRQLLECDNEQELRYLVLDGYIGRILADQRQYAPADARRYLAWIARFLNGAEVSPFDREASDPTVFDLADLTPPDPPRRYRLLLGLIMGLTFGLIIGLTFGLISGVLSVLVWGLLSVLPAEDNARSTYLTLAWPSTRQQFRDFFRGMVWELTLGLVFGLAFGLFVWLVFGLAVAVVLGVVLGVAYGLLEGLTSQLLKPWFVVITSLTPKDTRLRSLITALIYGLVSGLVSALFFGVFIGLLRGLIRGLFGGVIVALQVGIFVGLNHGGWFVLLQKVAHRRLRRADTLPPQPDDFLEWGIETQIFRRVGGGVRFRHNLIQQHLANISVATL